MATEILDHVVSLLLPFVIHTFKLNFCLISSIRKTEGVNCEFELEL